MKLIVVASIIVLIYTLIGVLSLVYSILQMIRHSHDVCPKYGAFNNRWKFEFLVAIGMSIIWPILLYYIIKQKVIET